MENSTEQKTKLLILDWDGTLLDNLELYYHSVSEVFKMFQLDLPTREVYRQEIDVDFMVFFYAHGVPGSVTREEVEQILKKIKYSYYEQDNNWLGIGLRENALEVLAECRALGIKTAVISAEVPEVLEKGLELFGARQHLDHVRGYAFDKASAILETCQQFGFSPSQVLYVDDLADGIQKAKQAEVTVFGIMKNGHNSAERILASQPHYTIHSLTEILEVLKGTRSSL